MNPVRQQLIDTAARAMFERKFAEDIAANTDIDWRWETLAPDTRSLWRTDAAAWLQKIAPLIADRINGEQDPKRNTAFGQGVNVGYFEAAALVRSLGTPE